jgi:hypothetical protein
VLDSDDLAKLQKAVLAGDSLESLGLEASKEVRETYERLTVEYRHAPPGTMAMIVEDLEWGKYDALIAATEKAHGPIYGDKSLAEALEERKRIVSERSSKKEFDAN